MSGRSAPPHPRRARAALAVALLVGCAATGRTADPPPAGGVEDVDDRPPLPPTEPKRPPLAVTYRIPDRDRKIFVGSKDKFGVVRGGIEDNKPLASEKQNPDEYGAWTEVVLWANRFPAAELEQVAARDLTPDDLTQPTTRGFFRLEPVRFDGTLATVRRVRATKAQQDLGLAEVFEGRLIPAGESAANPVVVVFTEYPPGLPGPPALGPNQAATTPVPVERWVTFAGYSFKVLAYPGPGADPANPLAPGWHAAPLLVGKSVTPLPGPPPALDAIPLDTSLRVFKLIPDDTPMGGKTANWEEVTAWNRVVLHAHRFSAERLEAAARKGLTFADLFTDGRSDYKLDLVHLEGRLVRLKAGKGNKVLADAGIPEWYEGWLIPKDEPRGNPVCIVITELPPGLKPEPLMNRWVTFAGYSFKLMRYQSGEASKTDPDQNVWKRAPLLIGKSVTVHAEDADGPGTWVTWFVPMVVGGLLAVVGTGLAVGWWYRQSDRKARAEVEATRQNPFAGGP